MMDDVPQHALISAMMLLEMLPNVAPEQRSEYAWAAHNLVQHAWQTLAGHPVRPLSDETQAILADISMKVAIEDAKNARS